MLLGIDKEPLLQRSFRPEPPVGARGTAGTAAVIATFVVVIAATLFVRLALAFEFPIPWSDEAAFLSQAFALSQNGSLFVAALNPHRILMWMPPGYMVLAAGMFKVIGYSFAAARWASATAFVAAFGVVVCIIRDYLRGWRVAVALLSLIAVVVTPYVIVVANIARMDALYTLCLLASLLAALRNRPLLGLAIVIATGTIHFNVVYFLPPYGAVLAASALQRRLPRIGRLEIACSLGAILCVSAYGVFGLLNWHAWLYDIGWQLRIHAQIPFRATPTDIALLVVLAAVPLRQAVAMRALTAEFFLSAYGAGFFVLAFHGDEMWYRFAYSLGLLLTILSCLVWSYRIPPGRRWLAGRVAMLGLVAALIGGIAYYATVSTPATASLEDLLANRVISKGSLKQTHAAIRALPRGSTVSFGFGFDGVEPFFFGDLASSGSSWIMTSYSATEGGPDRPSDYRVRCDSALYKRFINPKADGDFPRDGENTGCQLFRWHKTS